MSCFRINLSSTAPEDCQDCNYDKCNKLHPIGLFINMNKFYSLSYNEHYMARFTVSHNECIQATKDNRNCLTHTPDDCLVTSGWNVLTEIVRDGVGYHQRFPYDSNDKFRSFNEKESTNYELDTKNALEKYYRKFYVIKKMNELLLSCLTACLIETIPEELIRIICVFGCNTFEDHGDYG